jgi:hypothetical protein
MDVRHPCTGAVGFLHWGESVALMRSSTRGWRTRAHTHAGREGACQRQSQPTPSCVCGGIITNESLFFSIFSFFKFCKFLYIYAIFFQTRNSQRALNMNLKFNHTRLCGGFITNETSVYGPLT